LSATVPPFLPLDERIGYLTRKKYLFGSVPSETARERLGRINFHYFLGYARNYRLLGTSGLVPTDDALDRVFAVIDADRAVAVAVFRALGKLEWNLRALLVQHHCAMFTPSTCYLDPAHYIVLDPGLPPLETLLTRDICRSREPFVVEHFGRGGQAGELPVWAVVDTWSFGVLSRVICESVPVPSQDGESEHRLWKEVAGSLGVSASTVVGTLKAMSVLRNLVAHHARLWMRPTACTPKIPKAFPAHVRHNVDPKSMYGALLALAEMLGRLGEGGDFLNEVDEILAGNAAFKLGIANPVSTARQAKA
jgi:hypothetical protein